jgi:hypothetical protein
MKLTLHIWRQTNPRTAGRRVRYEVPNVSEHMSFLEMLQQMTSRALQIAPTSANARPHAPRESGSKSSHAPTATTSKLPSWNARNPQAAVSP